MSKQPHSNEKSVKTSIRDEAKLAESGKKNEREKDISRPKRDDSKQLLQSEASSTTKKTDVDAAVASPRAADVRSSKQTSFKIPKIVKSSDKATSASTDVAKNKPAEEAGQKNSQSLPAKCPPTEARNKSLEMPMNDVQNVVQSTSDRLKQSSSKIESVRRLEKTEKKKLEKVVNVINGGSNLDIGQPSTPRSENTAKRLGDDQDKIAAQSKAPSSVQNLEEISIKDVTATSVSSKENGSDILSQKPAVEKPLEPEVKTNTVKTSDKVREASDDDVVNGTNDDDDASSDSEPGKKRQSFVYRNLCHNKLQ